VFDVLRRAGADVQARDVGGNTILMWEVSRSASLAEVEELLRLGLDQSVRNENGETAQDMAEGLGLVRIVERLRETAG
jgi:ankyrin repeat protein